LRARLMWPISRTGFVRTRSERAARPIIPDRTARHALAAPGPFVVPTLVMKFKRNRNIRSRLTLLSV
jgi:hypothetical protein